MPTVTQSIGSAGRNFSTLQAWWDALPASLIADDNSYVGECYADSEFTGATQLLNATGKVTDASHTILLTAHAGQSFSDNAGVRTNRLNYVAANGVAITSSVASSSVINIDNNYFSISDLQVKATGSTSFAISSAITGGQTDINNCIFIANYRVFGFDAIRTVNNSVFQMLAGGSNLIGYNDSNQNTSNWNFCDFVSGSDVGSPPAFGFYAFGGQVVNLKNCAIFGATDATGGDGSQTFNFTTCMTDATGATGLTGGIIYANQFVNTTDAAGDWRQKAGSSFQGAGTADVTNGAFDISGLARPQGSNWDIGAWELAGGAPVVIPTIYFDTIF